MQDKLLVNVEGHNLDRLLSQIVKKYSLYEIKRPSYNNITFEILKKDYNNFVKENEVNNLKVEIVKSWSILQLLLKYSGWILATIIGILCLWFCNGRLMQVEIICDDLSMNNMISSIVDDNVVMGSRLTNEQLNSLEQLIMTSNDKISLISVTRQGNTLVINAKPQTIKNIDYEPIFAPYDMVIESIEVYSGTSEYKPGDIVRGGTAIVSPIIDESNSMVKPNASIEGRAYIVGCVTYKDKEMVKQRTGNKLVNITYSFMNNIINQKINDNSYQLYETELQEYYLTNYFLPIKVTKEIIYELQEKEVLHNFEEEKEKLINDSKNIAYSVLKEKNCDIIEQVNIVIVEEITYIKTTLEFVIRINNESNI